MWTPELDKRVEEAVRASLPGWALGQYFDDAFQEARLAILEAGEGQTPAWYVQRGIWAAKDYVRREGSGPVMVNGFDMDGFDGEGHHCENEDG